MPRSRIGPYLVLSVVLVVAVGVGSALGAIPPAADGPDQGLPQDAGITLTTVARLFKVGDRTVSGTVTCPMGRVVGGGFQASSDVIITLSYPSAADQWQVAGHSLSGPRPVFAWAICLTT